MKTLIRWALIVAIGLLTAEAAWAAAPELDILSPREGGTIHPDPKLGAVVVTEFEVKHFKIVDFTGVTIQEPGVGHILIRLDNQPFSTIHTESKISVFGQVTPGKHTVTLELVNNDHTPLKPRVIKTVHFTVASH